MKWLKSKTQDEDSNRRMQDIFQADLAEAGRTDIRAKFDSGYIPGVHHPAEHLAPGVHGWYDSDGKLTLFEPATEEITPQSLDAWQEARLAQLEAKDA